MVKTCAKHLWRNTFKNITCNKELQQNTHKHILKIAFTFILYDIFMRSMQIKITSSAFLVESFSTFSLIDNK